MQLHMHLRTSAFMGVRYADWNECRVTWHTGINSFSANRLLSLSLSSLDPYCISPSYCRGHNPRGEDTQFPLEVHTYDGDQTVGQSKMTMGIMAYVGLGMNTMRRIILGPICTD